MRLLFISNLYPSANQPLRGIHNARLIRHLAKVCEVRVIAPRPQRFLSRADGINSQADSPLPEDAEIALGFPDVAYIPLIGSPLNHRLFARGIRSLLEQQLQQWKPDVILAGWLYPDACGIISAVGGRIPIFPIAQGSDVHQYLKNRHRRRAILKYCSRTNGIMTRSLDLANRLHHAGLEAEKIRPIYNGVDTELFVPGDQAIARKELSLPDNGKIVLFVGNLYPVKNPQLLLEAGARMEEKATLVYVGDGELKKNLKSRGKSLGISDKLHFAGRQAPARVVRYMQAADVLVVPSLNEGIPNVIREAFACGLPVVATNVGGIPEVVTEPWLGSLVESRNVEELTKALSQRLRETTDTSRIRLHAEQFSWPNTVDECLAFIRSRT